jgi:Ankyrin repeats (3 copies)
LVIAREHGFVSWPRFAKHIEGLGRKHSRILDFESAAEAIVTGDVATLESLLRKNPELIRTRSTRTHRATLLHYVSANGVENYRQKTPKNAVAVVKILLEAGAEVDATADMYGGGATTLGLVATSVHPERAGVQEALMELLLTYGAVTDTPGVAGNNHTAVVGCLANGRGRAAEFLAGHGARLDLVGAGGVGRLDVVKSFFNEDDSLNANETKEDMDSGFVWACLYGRTNVVKFLLQKGVDLHAHENIGQAGLHNAVIGGHLDVVKLLLERKAPLEAKNVFGGTVLGQATWCVMNGDRSVDYVPTIEMLLGSGAKVEEADYPTGNERVDELLRRHGAK